MEAISHLFGTLSLDQLTEVQVQLNQLIQERKSVQKIEQILTEVEKNGYFCTTLCIEFPHLTLPLRVNLHAWINYDEMGNVKVGGISEKQLPWVDRLCFDYTPSKKDNWRLSWDEWRCSGAGEAVKNTGFIDIYVYYKKLPCPPEGTIFESVNEEGDIDEMEIKDGKIYCFGEVLDSVDEWDDYDIMVIPYE